MCLYRVIDCTGDADIAHMAGAEYRKTGDQETKTTKQKTKRNQQTKQDRTKQNRKTGVHHHPQMTTSSPAIILTIFTHTF